MSSTLRYRASSASENGSAIAEFVFVSALIALLCAGVFQLAFALHVRNTLIDCAGEGARHAALVGTSLDDGVKHTARLIDAALPDGYSRDVAAAITEHEGASIVEVRIRAPLPLTGFLGPNLIDVTGRAVME